jgi:hypothetical protein
VKEGRTVLTFAQKLQVLDVLKTVCTSDNGFAVYEQEWTDRRTAEHASATLGYAVQPWHVSWLRKETFGDIHVKSTDPRIAANVMSEIEDLLNTQREAIKQLEEQVKKIDGRLNTLELALKFNVGAKVK